MVARYSDADLMSFGDLGRQAVRQDVALQEAKMLFYRSLTELIQVATDSCRKVLDHYVQK